MGESDGLFCSNLHFSFFFAIFYFSIPILQLWGSQEELHGHCLTHSQELMCMKCFLTFDDQNQFRKHLYYEHEAEHHPCSACRRKSWQHVYHFCIKQETNVCEICDRNFETLQQYRYDFIIWCCFSTPAEAPPIFYGLFTNISWENAGELWVGFFLYRTF